MFNRKPKSHIASPREVKAATRNWAKYKASVVLKQHPELDKDDLITFFELAPWDSFDISNFKKVNEGAVCEPSL
jgi:hypothetical protein